VRQHTWMVPCKACSLFSMRVLLARSVSYWWAYASTTIVIIQKSN
jgi:hypothetical protein